MIDNFSYYHIQKHMKIVDIMFWTILLRSAKSYKLVQNINLQRIMNYQDMLAIFQNAGYMGLYGGLDVEKTFSFFAIVDSEYEM